MAPIHGPMATNTSVNSGKAKETDRAPSHGPMATNTSVNSGMTKEPDRAPSHGPMATNTSVISGRVYRTAMVSGGFEPVMDGGGGKNPVFAKALMDVLRDDQSIMDGSEVFERLKRPVVLASEQTPEYADIRLAGHDGGQFLLVRQDAITEQPSVSDGADPLEKIGNKCTALGFTKGTEKHSDCVMKLYK